MEIFWFWSFFLILQSFTASLINPTEWVSKLSLQIKPVEPVLDAGAQIQQMVNVECVEDYTGNGWAIVVTWCIFINIYILNYISEVDT